MAEGADGLYDRLRSGRPPVVDEAMAVAETLTPLPAESGLINWSSRELARRIGASHNEIAAIWRNWGIRPHRTESFKFSTDPELEAKIIDIVGLYMKLERSQPMLSVARGLAERRSHDYR